MAWLLMGSRTCTTLWLWTASLAAAWTVIFVLVASLPACSYGLESQPSTSRSHGYRRSDLKINSCEAVDIVFDDNDQSLKVNAHCTADVVAVAVEGENTFNINGLYEEYGRFSDTSRYELVFSNGSKAVLRRHRMEAAKYKFVWELSYKNRMLYVSFANNDQKYPKSSSQWFSYSSERLVAADLRTSKVHFKPYQPSKTNASVAMLSQNHENYHNSFTRNEEKVYSLSYVLAESLEINDIEGRDLQHTLHPAVGPELGQMLHNRYMATVPFPAIVIDNLFNDTVLRGAVAAVSSASIDEWIGPEADPGCCREKYRLPFTSGAFRRDPWCAMLATVVADPRFISFIEQLTGITELVPLVDRSTAQGGSSIIGIKSGGFLYVHNDVRSHGWVVIS
jgi:hypothetical protein